LSRIAENRLRDILDKFHADKRDVHKEIPFKKKGRSTKGGSVGAAWPIGTTTPSVIMRKKEALDKLEKALDELKPEYFVSWFVSSGRRFGQVLIFVRLNVFRRRTENPCVGGSGFFPCLSHPYPAQ
jgi:hypothetical protein